MSIFGRSVDNIQHGLNYSVLKNETISNNVANVDTANYKAKQVAFKSLLEMESKNGFKAKRTDPRHLDFGRTTNGFRISTHSNTQYNHNGNNVDIDKQMSELANNQIYYQSLVDRLNGHFNTLQTVIRGGR
ncbi:flagellar basal-body rod protein FlgB [Amphibacillus marinus]|uniref:Flagellar basal body rod protein FlgB n=1 Tax=Amphibacillus marinus TaxID=872970 RepID=A0A1H8HT50_9BACI|nr:flagellar basal body rod protein FlgB [Amphibacillus marinus]SEN59283.1 flagellar basal-body rod protein FlgB [Amphibacillus marinus]